MPVNYEKKQLEYSVDIFEKKPYKNLPISELIEYLEDVREKGATHFYLDYSTDREDIEFIEINFLKYVEETDAEWNARVLREEKADKEAGERAEERAEETMREMEAEDRRIYESLKKRFEP